MPTKQEAKILRYAGWDWKDIKNLNEYQMKIIKKSLFYSNARLGLALKQLWSDIKQSLGWRKK